MQVFRPELAANQAIARAQRVLFLPFEPRKYAAIGLGMWLWQLGGGPTSWGCRSGPVQVRPDVGDELVELVELAGGWNAVIAVAAVGVVLSVAVAVAALFLQARGAFLVLDGLVRDRGELWEPWTGYRREANSLFGFRLALVGGITVVVAVLIAGFAWGLPVADDPVAAWTTLVASWALIAPVTSLILVGVLLDGAVREFVVPIQYVRRTGVLDGLRDLMGLVSRQPTDFFVYLLCRLVAGIVAGLIMGIITWLSLGLAALPYVGTLLVLPLLAALRLFSLEFLGQLDEDLAAGLVAGRADT